MKKSYIVIGVIALLLLIVFFVYKGAYDKAINYRNSVDQAWGDVGAQYQRRADLVPQLVATVKGAANNEKEILTRVTEARAGIVNAKTPEDFEMLGKEINTAINMAFEAYPQIRSTDNFSKLQNQLEGTENRISFARKNYNAKVKDYNTHIESFINSMLLSSSTFPKKEMFKAMPGSEVAPTVNFE